MSGCVFAAVGLCGFYLLREDKRAPMKKDRLLAVSFSFLFSMTAAGLWEIVEYVIYLFFGNDSQYAVAPYAGFNGVADTMEDMMILSLIHICLSCGPVSTAAMASTTSMPS